MVQPGSGHGLHNSFVEDHIPSTGEYDPFMHVFLNIGNDNILAFFELPNQPDMGRDENTPEWVQHLAFRVGSKRKASRPSHLTRGRYIPLFPALINGRTVAHINHVELVRKARGAEMPESFYRVPLIYQGGSDNFLAPRDDISLGSFAWGCDIEGEVAVITDDVPMGVSNDDAAEHIKLLMLVNDVSLRGLIPGELAKGWGFFSHSLPARFRPLLSHQTSWAIPGEIMSYTYL